MSDSSGENYTVVNCIVYVSSEHSLFTKTGTANSVVHPDQDGSKTFGRIRIRVRDDNNAKKLFSNVRNSQVLNKNKSTTQKWTVLHKFLNKYFNKNIFYNRIRSFMKRGDPDPKKVVPDPQLSPQTS